MSSKTNDYGAFTFGGQRKGERVLYWCREHPVSVLSRLLFYIGFSILGLGVLQLGIFRLAASDAAREVYWEFVIASHLSVICMILLWCWVTWVVTMFVITDQRLLKRVAYTPFTSFTFGLRLSQSLDLRYTYRTFVHGLLDFGNLVAQSAVGTGDPFVAINIGKICDLHHYLHKLTSMLEEADREGKLAPELPVFVD
ncbi:hypothetical protein OAO01_00705 [Oligoflexia bacterium]|nr:hypothetical protein [Oligoflexia bacterium]